MKTENAQTQPKEHPASSSNDLLCVFFQCGSLQAKFRLSKEKSHRLQDFVLKYAMKHGEIVPNKVFQLQSDKDE